MVVIEHAAPDARSETTVGHNPTRQTASSGHTARLGVSATLCDSWRVILWEAIDISCSYFCPALRKP